GRGLPDDWRLLAARAAAYERELGDAMLPGGAMLLMNGSDQVAAQPTLPAVVRDANEGQDRYRFSLTSLPEYLDAQPDDGLPVWQGELRSGARANVLMGVASNRVDVHQLAAQAERAVERTGEPLVALYASPDSPAVQLLDLAWERLVLDSAHDSSCACSQ